MKGIVILSLFLALFAVFFPVISAAGNPLVYEKNSDIADPPENGGLTGNSDMGGAPELVCDNTITVTMKDGDSTVTLTMDEYLTGVVAAEMPASFEPEALKAQAVACRTYTLYRMNVAPCENHPDTDVCSSSLCCMAWHSEKELLEKWGDDYEFYLSVIKESVTGTDGQYLSYEESPALTVFHSSSHGFTEESAAVWSEELPYLVSVESPENKTSVPDFEVSVTLSASEFKETVLTAFPAADLTLSPEKWLGRTYYTKSGRVAFLELGGVNITGTQLRSLFSLRSTALDINISGDEVTITSTGYGHGVGMSQYGANSLALSGSSYLDILSLYYPNTELAISNA